MPWKRRRSWTADNFCGPNHWDLGEQGSDMPWVPVPSNDEFDADVVPFQPAFSAAGAIFAHCPYLPGPCLPGNPLCRVDWLSLGGTAGWECAILPILEMANFSRRSSGGQSSPRERPSARRTCQCRRLWANSKGTSQKASKTAFSRVEGTTASTQAPCRFQPRFLPEQLMSTPASLIHSRKFSEQDDIFPIWASPNCWLAALANRTPQTGAL